MRGFTPPPYQTAARPAMGVYSSGTSRYRDLLSLVDCREGLGKRAVAAGPAPVSWFWWSSSQASGVGCPSGGARAVCVARRPDGRMDRAASAVSARKSGRPELAVSVCAA